jgi:hypothetical protein
VVEDGQAGGDVRRPGAGGGDAGAHGRETNRSR